MADSADDFQKPHTVIKPPKEIDEETVDDSDVDLGDAISEGQYSISGSEPAPQSDDNVAEAAKAVGLYDDPNIGTPQLNVADEIQQAEKAIQDAPPPGAQIPQIMTDSDDDEDNDYLDDEFPEEDEE